MKRTFGWTLAVLLIWFFAGILYDPLGISFFVAMELLWRLLFGWVDFVSGTFPHLHIQTPSVSWSLAIFVMLTLGLHRLLRSRWSSSPLAPAIASPPRIWYFRWTALIVANVLLSSVAGICVLGIAHQAVWMVTSPKPPWSLEFRSAGAMRRAESKNNLKQIGLGFYNFAIAESGSLPPSRTTPTTVRQNHGWQTFLLPHLDYAVLYRQVNLHKPWTHSANKPVFTTRLEGFQNPAYFTLSERLDEHGYSLTHYSGNEHVLGRRGMAFAKMTDGTATTILAGEVSQRFRPWGHHANWRDPVLGIHKSPEGFGSPSIGGASFLFADGSVRFVDENINRDVLRALSTPDGHEAIPQEW